MGKAEATGAHPPQRPRLAPARHHGRLPLGTLERQQPAAHPVAIVHPSRILLSHVAALGERDALKLRGIGLEPEEVGDLRLVGKPEG